MSEKLSDEQIVHMVQRFLAWKLPEDFRPDGGITFNAVGNLGTEHQYRREPMGTNLFDARQAEAMVRYIVAGMPAARAEARPAPVVDREAMNWDALANMIAEAVKSGRNNPSTNWLGPLIDRILALLSPATSQ